MAGYRASSIVTMVFSALAWLCIMTSFWLSRTYGLDFYGSYLGWIVLFIWSGLLMAATGLVLACCISRSDCLTALLCGGLCIGVYCFWAVFLVAQ